MKRRTVIKSALSALPALTVTDAFGKASSLLSDICYGESIPPSRLKLPERVAYSFKIFSA